MTNIVSYTSINSHIALAFLHLCMLTVIESLLLMTGPSNSSGYNHTTLIFEGIIYIVYTLCNDCDCECVRLCQLYMYIVGVLSMAVIIYGSI